MCHLSLRGKLTSLQTHLLQAKRKAEENQIITCGHLICQFFRCCMTVKTEGEFLMLVLAVLHSNYPIYIRLHAKHFSPSSIWPYPRYISEHVTFNSAFTHVTGDLKMNSVLAISHNDVTSQKTYSHFTRVHQVLVPNRIQLQITQQSLSVIINPRVNAHKSNPITQEGTWTQRWPRPVSTD